MIQTFLGFYANQKYWNTRSEDKHVFTNKYNNVNCDKTKGHTARTNDWIEIKFFKFAISKHGGHGRSIWLAKINLINRWEWDFIKVRRIFLYKGDSSFCNQWQEPIEISQKELKSRRRKGNCSLNPNQNIPEGDWFLRYIFQHKAGKNCKAELIQLVALLGRGPICCYQEVVKCIGPIFSEDSLLLLVVGSSPDLNTGIWLAFACLIITVLFSRSSWYQSMSKIWNKLYGEKHDDL